MSIGVPQIRVLPQIAPLIKDEAIVGKDTLQRNRFSKRTSGNFRNNLLAEKETERFECLQQMISRTWGSMKINSIAMDSNRNCVSLDIRDGDFVTEIYYMGHGIQMWLQTLWFIVSSEKNSIIVLDEPDVYMHADMQRKLVRMIIDNYSQMIIATHSVEIMAEVQPDDILIINRKESESFLADSYPVIQNVISGMGSIHNIDLARLLNNKRYLYLEGNDMDILKIFYDKLFSREDEPLDHFLRIPTGGWGSWQLQKAHAQRLLADIPDAKAYFIYDRDYHSDDEIDTRTKDARSSNIRMHIWKRKEIENYVVVNSAIARFICKKDTSYSFDEICSEVQDMILSECNAMKENVISKMGDEVYKTRKGVEPSTVFNAVKKEVDNRWTSFESIVCLVPGKLLISRISERCKKEYNVSFSAQQIAFSMHKSEIDHEICEYLCAIRDGK